MTCRCPATLLLFLLVASAPLTVGAQSAQQDHTQSGIWFAGGGAFTTVRGNCPTCEDDGLHRRGGSVLGGLGIHVNGRVDVGGEVFWSASGGSRSLYTTHLDAVVRFRPRSSAGFFLTGGAGMAFVRNWVNEPAATPIASKTLSVVVGAGWAFRPAERVGLQVFGTQHAAAFGDLQTPGGEVGDVLANSWSAGAAVVLRRRHTGAGRRSP